MHFQINYAVIKGSEEDLNSPLALGKNGREADTEKRRRRFLSFLVLGDKTSTYLQVDSVIYPLPSGTLVSRVIIPLGHLSG